ncbi:MAG: response regulator [Myxococcales bacterium]|nr:response regulator [Myxococcales bacterium]
MADLKKRMECPSCGTMVPVEHALEGDYLLSSCRLCGLGLDVTRASRALKNQFQPAGDIHTSSAGMPAMRHTQSGSMAAVRPTQSGSMAAVRPSHTGSMRAMGAADSAERPPPVMSAPVKQMRKVHLVEDSDFLRQITRDLLNERQLAQEIAEAPDGQAFIEAYTRDVQHGEKPDLIVLDVRMPGIDGREAAYAIRAIETAMGARPTPILFFSAVLCDDEFKAQLRDLGNARYIRKSDGGDPNQLGNRVVSVLERLVGVRQQG